MTAKNLSRKSISETAKFKNNRRKACINAKEKMHNLKISYKRIPPEVIRPPEGTQNLIKSE